MLPLVAARLDFRRRQREVPAQRPLPWPDRRLELSYNDSSRVVANALDETTRRAHRMRGGR